MSAPSDAGLAAWRQAENNNRMIDRQERLPAIDDDAPIELAYFGGSAFRLTAPSGLTVMIDPWRNHPSGGRDWFQGEFSAETVDIALSTHAHFDHDALHRLSASVILDRLIGRYEFADVAITGIAEKHVSDTTHALHDWAAATRRMTPVRTDPPDNWRCFDNSLLLVEMAGLRILHWGDNRPDPPESVWARLGRVDIALLPIDGSWHVLSPAQIATIVARLQARIVVPHHYFVPGLTTAASTLLPPDAWVAAQPAHRRLDAGRVSLRPSEVRRHAALALCFGAHVVGAR